MTPPATTYCEPTVLWRREIKSGATVEAVAVPTWQSCSLVFRVGGRPRTAIDFTHLAAAIAHADHVRRRLERRGVGRGHGQG